MGHSLLESTRRTMIRIVIVVCCAALAAAEAEADPAEFYRSYAHHGLYQPDYTAGYTAGYPSAVRTYASPLTTSYTTGYHGYQAAPPLLDPTSHTGMLPVADIWPTLSELSTLPRERLSQKPRLRLKLTLL